MRREDILRLLGSLLAAERASRLIPRCSRNWRTACPNAASSWPGLLSILMLGVLSFRGWSCAVRPQCGGPKVRRQAVADAPGHAHPALGAGAGELASQTAGVRVHGARRVRGGIRPDL